MKIGIIGTGQLSLMLAQSMKEFGASVKALGAINCESLTEYAETHEHSLKDKEAMQNFIDSVDVVTYDTEHVPMDVLDAVDTGQKLNPGKNILKIFQNRFYEKNYLVSQNIATARYIPLHEQDNLSVVKNFMRFPVVLKTIQGGYDGHGQQWVKNADDLETAWKQLNNAPCIVEEKVNFEQEVSITAARDYKGNIVYYPVAENFHVDGILRLSLVSGKHRLQKQAESIVHKIMQDLEYIGCMTVELFVSGGELFVNEIAPRVHNSAHWTMDGASVSQFSNHMKAISGKTVESPEVQLPIAMINLIGDTPPLTHYRDIPHVQFYDYCKEKRPGRKLGHINVMGADLVPSRFYAITSSLLEEIGEEACSDYIFMRVINAA